MADHMNVFEPYVSKAPHHEDALTRAFLLVLRGVPVAHAAWLVLVDRAHRANRGEGIPPLHELGTPAVETQTSTVPSVERVLSLLQTDEAYFRDKDALPSPRRQVLDGVVSYGGAFAIVLENKPSNRNIWEDQLDVSLPSDSMLDPRVACVAWKDIVLAWAALLEAQLLSPAEAVLLGDFLNYVEERFPSLRPYSRVSLCGTDIERLQRRCRILLLAIAGEGNVAYHRPSSWFVRLADGHCAVKVALLPRRRSKDLCLTVEIAPGDTSSQARILYRDVSLPDLQALASHGWELKANLHFAHMQKNELRTDVALTIEGYWDFWKNRVEWIRQWKRPEFEQVLADLVAKGLASDQDRKEFDRKFVKTNWWKFNMCPGLILNWWLPLDEAAQLDQQGGLQAAVKAAIEDAASALKARLPW
jgi:hypothetical protein